MRRFRVTQKSEYLALGPPHRVFHHTRGKVTFFFFFTKIRIKVY